MDIQAINEAIEELEKDDTTVDNVSELASLYIVKEHLSNSCMPTISSVEKELMDILPSYKKYCDIKRQYQLNLLPRKSVVNGMRGICIEIEEFINTLYSSTDTAEERHLLHNTLQQLCEHI